MKKEKAKRLLSAIGELDDATIDAAAPSCDQITERGRARRVKFPHDRRTLRRIVALAACFALVIGLSLYLFIPINDAPRISAYADDEYYPVISAIAYAYYTPSKYKNNFDRLLSSALSVKNDASGGDVPESSAPPTDNGNGSYTEVTDNQVAGVIEADLVKATDKYIFRLSRVEAKGSALLVRVYSAAGEESVKLGELEIDRASRDKYVYFNTAEMYLSADATRLTVIQTYRDKKLVAHTLVQSVDLSDVTNMRLTDSLTVSGEYVDSRMVDGRLLLVSSYAPQVSAIKYSDPDTYIPTIDRGEGAQLLPMQDIIMPSVAGKASYSVVTLLSEDGLETIDAMATYNFTDGLYATESSIYLVNPYTRNESGFFGVDYSEIVCLGWGEQGITSRGTLTVEGEIKDQYSLDEREGHLRVVTTTSTTLNENGARIFADDASLFVFDLADMTLRASVEYFAPTGESAESVRFDGDKLYVCTAIVLDPVNVCDPVYFFDLSDYDNITATDTGTIDGFSSSLIQLPNGYLLGIGEIYGFPKLEVYREEDGKVVSVDIFAFVGVAPTEYKAYFINRELGLIGMQVNGYCELDEEDGYIPTEDSPRGDLYVVLRFDGTELTCLQWVESNASPDRARAIYMEGYLYILTDEGLTVIDPFAVALPDEA